MMHLPTQIHWSANCILSPIGCRSAAPFFFFRHILTAIKTLEFFMDTTISSYGSLKISVISLIGSYPIKNAIIRISPSNEPNAPKQEYETNTEGQLTIPELPAPDEQFSEAPSAEQPYTDYNLEVSAPGYETVEINNINVLPNTQSLQFISLMPITDTRYSTAELFVIPANTLFGDFPPKVYETETKPVSETGEIVLSRVVVPEFVIVHDGPPSDRSANDYYVPYKDYIKNVASSEIYATWPEATLIANILAIQSFTMNRVYTEWYRNKGYNFTFTSSTAFDQKWVYNRNIYEPISLIVDGIFDQYLARPNVKQPILTQYCDGNRVSCPNWLSQWGSKYLGDQGYSASEIIRYYYGDSMYIATAEEISGIPASWPGSDLSIGSSGSKVAQLQSQLNMISKAYPLVPKVAEDGVYGSNTANAVRIFQSIFDLPQTGVTDFSTWYKISEVFVGVSNIAELV